MLETQELEEDCILSRGEIKALKELVKKEQSLSEKPICALNRQEEASYSPVSRQELARANRRFKLGLDMQEKDLSSLLYTAIMALEEMYGLIRPKVEDLNVQFRELLQELSLQLLERNKASFKEEAVSPRTQILDRLV